MPWRLRVKLTGLVSNEIYSGAGAERNSWLAAFLLMAVAGSRIIGERLSGRNPAIALLANSIATGAALRALILVFGPGSEARFSPVVALAESFAGGLARALRMFGLSLISLS